METDGLYQYEELKAVLEDVDQEEIASVRDTIITTQSELEQFKLPYSSNVVVERELLLYILNDVTSQMEYNSYLSGILENTDKMSGISIFQNNTFSCENAKKTSADFRRLQNKISDALVYETSIGVEKALYTWNTDILLCIIIFLVTGQLLMSEKEENQLILIKSFKLGRTPAVAAKVLAGEIYLFICSFLFYLTDVITSATMYGLGTLSRPIQMVSEFISCPFQVSVLEFIVYSFLFRVLILSLFYFLMLVLCVSARNASEYYVRVFLITGIEIVLYVSIQYNSFLVNLKKLNLVSFLRTEKTLGVYDNLNLFGHPVTYLWVALFICIMGVFLLFLLLCRRYNRCEMITRHGEIRSGFLCRMKNKFNEQVEATVSIIIHEFHKILITQKMLLALLLLILIQFLTYEPKHISISDLDEWYYKQYMDYLEGEVTEEKLTYLNKQEETREQIQTEYDTYLSTTDVLSTEIIQNFNQRLLPFRSLSRVNERTEYLLKQENGSYFYDTGYLCLLGKQDGDNYRTLFLLLLILMIITILPIYTMDSMYGMDRLLNSTRNGKRKLGIRKAEVGICIAFILMVVIMTPYIYNICHAYGTTAFSMAVNSMEAFWWVPSMISILGFFLIQILLTILAVIFVTLLILYIGKKSRTHLEGYLLCIIFLLLPYLVVTFIF